MLHDPLAEQRRYHIQDSEECEGDVQSKAIGVDRSLTSHVPKRCGGEAPIKPPTDRLKKRPEGFAEGAKV